MEDNTMEITIFAKRRKSKDNNIFYQYLSTLTKKDGTTETVRVAFRDCQPPKPDSCPRNITFAKTDANMATNTYTDTEGNKKQRKTLWLTTWENGTEYVDHSMDDYV